MQSWKAASGRVVDCPPDKQGSRKLLGRQKVRKHPDIRSERGKTIPPPMLGRQAGDHRQHPTLRAKARSRSRLQRSARLAQARAPAVTSAFRALGKLPGASMADEQGCLRPFSLAPIRPSGNDLRLTKRSPRRASSRVRPTAGSVGTAGTRSPLPEQSPSGLPVLAASTVPPSPLPEDSHRPLLGNESSTSVSASASREMRRFVRTPPRCNRRP